MLYQHGNVCMYLFIERAHNAQYMQKNKKFVVVGFRALEVLYCLASLCVVHALLFDSHGRKKRKLISYAGWGYLSQNLPDIY